jgi:hypothetical protein
VQSVDVASLAALMTDKASYVSVYDVDLVRYREKMGVIPGALVLSSRDKFDVATDGRLRALGEFQIGHLVERHDRAPRLLTKRIDTPCRREPAHDRAEDAGLPRRLERVEDPIDHPTNGRNPPG